ncbi:A disintegrin and metalloproteinase with thrombospondin motifs like [Linepithema humile]|uniref:A disintegrin and metalloproteinase with thrombospondin motifs like n=1 Tax=Linepithema humile TaxID=83485 RepID=UPI000623AF24|nr:PREDICTED: venom metalloproteinase 3-like [Linepithema humile]
MFLTVFLLYLAGTPLIQCKQLHEYMTPAEVKTVFHTPHDLVPEYEVVPVLHRLKKQTDSKDDTSEIKLKAFEEDMNIYLNPTEGSLATTRTPVWTVSSDTESPEGLLYKQVPGAMKSLGVTLQDVSTSSSVLLTPTPNGKVHLDGVLKNSYVIKSLPQRVLDKVVYGGHKLFEPHHTKNVTSDDEYASTHHHVVYKIPPSSQYNDFKITNPETHRAKRNAPDVIYPEMLVVLDYREFKLLGEDLQQAVTYLVSYWNGVDLRFRSLTAPRIRLSIAGLIIATDENATPYLEKSIFEYKPKRSTVDSDLALRGMANYFYRETRFPPDFYDMAIAMTQLDMCNMLTDDFCDSPTLGYAYVAGACDRNATKQLSEAVGIVEDNAGFGGIIPTAHEIGHLIGARHDGNPNTAAECPPSGGYIMTTGLALGENGFKWSKCSINAFYKFLNEPRAKCLYNEPKDGEQVPRILPGKLLSLDEQCKNVMGTKACNRDATVCTYLECQYPNFDDCTASAPAAEGSPCGDGLYCLNGRCVLEGIPAKEQKKKQSPKKFKLQTIKQMPWVEKIVEKMEELFS